MHFVFCNVELFLNDAQTFTADLHAKPIKTQTKEDVM